MCQLCAPESELGCGFCDLLLTSVTTRLQPTHSTNGHLGLGSGFWVYDDCSAARESSGFGIWLLLLGSDCSWELLCEVEICFWHLGLCSGFWDLLKCHSVEALRAFGSLMLHKDHWHLRFDICHWVLLNLEHSGPTVGLVQASRWAGIRLLRFALEKLRSTCQRRQ